MPRQLPSTTQDSTKAVDDFMASLDHACKPEIQALRATILGADPAIGEGVKWNAPSFRTSRYFATIHLREKAGVSIILHLDAKARDASAPTLRIEDPDKLLDWRAADRARVTFRDMADLDAKRSAFAALIRAWIAHL